MRLLVAFIAAALISSPAAPIASADAGPYIGDRYAGVVKSASFGDFFPKTKLGAISLMGGSYWPELEVRPGVWDFNLLDQKVENARRHGAKPMLVLGFSPRFHSTRPHAADPRIHPPKMAAWRRYVRKVANRYGSRLDYQVWPEPNIVQNWGGTPAQLAGLQRAAYQEIKRVTPKAVVGGPAVVVRLPGQREWMRKFYSARPAGQRVGRFLDFIPLDPYPMESGTPEDSMKLIQAARRIAREAGGVRKPVWSVEINYGIPSGGPSGRRQFTNTKQISYVLRTYALSPAYGVRRVYWLGWGHYPTFGISLTRPDGVTPSPAGRAWARGRTWMLGYRHEGCKRASTGVWTCTLVGAKETRRIMWRPGKARYVKAPARAFMLHRGTGSAAKVRPGQSVKITGMPTLFRSRR